MTIGPPTAHTGCGRPHSWPKEPKGLSCHKVAFGPYQFDVVGPKDIGGCKGLILGNKCKKCDRPTAGVKSFLMKLQLADLQDKDTRMEMSA